MILFLSWQESGTRFSHELNSFFPKEHLSKKERVLYFLGEEEISNPLSQRQKKDLARAIVRSSQRLQLPDGTLFSGVNPDVDLFLFNWAKVRTNFGSVSKANSRYGILGLTETTLKEFEKRNNVQIERKFDALNYNIQYKISIILYKELLATDLNAKEAYFKLFELPPNSNEWDILEKSYLEIHKKTIPENL